MHHVHVCVKCQWMQLTNAAAVHKEHGHAHDLREIALNTSPRRCASPSRELIERMDRNNRNLRFTAVATVNEDCTFPVYNSEFSS